MFTFGRAKPISSKLDFSPTRSHKRLNDYHLLPLLLMLREYVQSSYVVALPTVGLQDNI